MVTVPDEQLCVTVGIGIDTGSRITTGSIIFHKRDPNDLVGFSLKVIPTGCVWWQRMLRVFKYTRGAVVARYMEVTVIIFLDETTRFLVDE